MMRVTLPVLLGRVHDTPRDVRLRLRLPRELLYFQGHFPAAPILPAVVQIDWAVYYAREILGLEGDFAGMDRLKFSRVLMPLDEPELRLWWQPEKVRLEFSYSTARGRHSSGQLGIR
jgi:3-hydroxymyristoyl/3-hydroxydecanoyl-(acyl carrier protein) dehydratase